MKKNILEVLLCEIQVHRNTVFEKKLLNFQWQKITQNSTTPHTIGCRSENYKSNSMDPYSLTAFQWYQECTPPISVKFENSIDVINWNHIG